MEHKSRIDAMLSGTTCVMTFFNHDMILCANAGDSRAILVSEHEKGSGPGEGHYYFTQLSRDHKPELPDEAQRILARNGRIEPSRITPDMYQGGFNRRAKFQQPQFFGPKRVWLKNKQLPGLAMTRSIGDLVAGSVGVTPEPEL
jgi:serine/threonine protein phosphatase PrpC